MPFIRSYLKQNIHVMGWTFDEFTHIFEQPVSPANHRCAGSRGGGSIEFTTNRMIKEPNWYGGLSRFDDVTSMLTNGWPEGAERITKAAGDLARVLPRIKDRKRRLTRGETGDDLIIDAALQGNWDRAWTRSVRTWTDGPTSIDVYAEFGGNADRSANELFWAGASAVIISDLLEAAGYATRIIGVSLNISDGSIDGRTGGTARQYAQILLKDSDEPLRRDVVAAVLCHAAVFRSYGFRMLSCNPGYLNPQGLGHMAPVYQIAESLRQVNELDGNAIHVSAMRSEKACISNIKEILAPFLENE